MTARRLRHGRIDLALWSLRPGASPRAAGSPPPPCGSGEGRPLLLLHELGGRSSDALPPEVAANWAGPVWALDFTGHGGSTVPAGGGYSAEILMADADAALAALGEATVLGWGLGAYVALLIAGARPALVKGAVLADGRGLEGGGPRGGEMLVRPGFDPAAAPPDPFALHELSSDPRPPGYAQIFVRQAVHLSGMTDPIAVAATARPAWLAEVLSHPGVVESELGTALHRFASA